ncbi:MAG: non-canonical purine NTP pyrophosphatase [Syntrophobacteraceae bacterium]
MSKIEVVFVTSSEHKIAENNVLHKECTLEDGQAVKDLFEFDIRQVPIKEVLEVKIDQMVRIEVVQAYSKIRVPCIVEHAGLIFQGYDHYPGGLTKPMWNVLGDRFIEETHSAARKAKALAVVAYCDGQAVFTFEGETEGTISDCPRGNRNFYWDTIFIPKDPSGDAGGKTYAEIVDDPTLGLKYKMTKLSQSARAVLRFLEFRRTNAPGLWRTMSS